MAKLKGKAKEEFLKRMERGRAKAKRSNGKASPKKKAAKKKAKKATAKKKTATKKKRKATAAKKFSRTEKKNPRQIATLGPAALNAIRLNLQLGKYGDDDSDDAVRQAARAYVRDGGKLSDLISRRKKTAKKNPRGRKRNSEGLAGAERMYETFHQKKPGHIVEYELPYHYPENFAELGTLRELKVYLDRANPKFPITSFGDCKVVCTPDGSNIYFVGGNQSVNLAELDIPTDKDDVDLGPCVYIEYHTTKGFHEFAPTNYWHLFGEEDNVYPRLNYNRMNKRLYLVGGNYRVKREGIVN